MDELTLLTTVFNQLFEDLSIIGMHIILKPFLCCCGSSTGGHTVGGYWNVKILYTVSTSISHSNTGILKDRFPQMGRHAERMLSLFGSTHRCEQTFSLMTLYKSRRRSKRTDSHHPDVCNLTWQLFYSPTSLFPSGMIFTAVILQIQMSFSEVKRLMAQEHILLPPCGRWHKKFGHTCSRRV